LDKIISWKVESWKVGKKALKANAYNNEGVKIG